VRYLAIDFGANNIGLAFADSSNNLVMPAGLIRNYGSITKLSVLLIEICSEKEIDAVVFGIPENSAKDSSQAIRYRSIGKRIEQLIKVKIPNICMILEDESFSSFEAMEILRNTRNRNAASEHEIAAMKLLERYLFKI
jgi:RNase H-fold protein (predicted Holliday junction resolvase)